MASVFIADSSLFMIGSMKFLLERMGHTVAGASADAKECLEKLRQKTPEFLIMDLSLGEEAGNFAMLRAVRTEFPRIKMIVMVSSADESRTDEARSLGADGFIKKPFKYEVIEAEVKRLLK